MKKITRLTESDLTRIVRRVISEDDEQSSIIPKCKEQQLNIIPKLISANEDLTLVFNEISNGVVTVISEAANMKCSCKKGELPKL